MAISRSDKLARRQAQEAVLRAWAETYRLSDPTAFVRRHVGLPLAPEAAQWLARAEAFTAAPRRTKTWRESNEQQR